MNASGTKGWIARSSGGFTDEVDLITGEKTLVFTNVQSVNGGVDICCSDDGQKIYGLGFSTITDRFYCIKSINGGSTWDEVAIGTVVFTNIAPINGSETFTIGRIECDGTGGNIKCVLVGSNYVDETIVFESTDNGDTWAEILTPRKTLLDPKNYIKIVEISRDLSTISIMGPVGNQKYLSVDGGAFTDVEAAMPVSLSAMNHRMAISNDGKVLVIFDSTRSSQFTGIYFSNDNAMTWSYISLEWTALTHGEGTIIGSIQFHPANNDLVYIQVYENSSDLKPMACYQLKLSKSKLTKLGIWNSAFPSSGAFTANMQHMSSIRLDGPDVILGQGVYTKAFSGGVRISNGKFIADAISEPIPYKIVADAPA